VKKTTIGKFIVYASEMVPEGCIFFVHPKDEKILIEAFKMIEELPMLPEQKKAAQKIMMDEMKKILTKVE